MLLLIVFFGLAGCGKATGGNPAGSKPAVDHKPDDFALSLSWASGAMPEPWMNYSYQIQIGPGGEGRLTYLSNDRSKALDKTFAVSTGNLEQLYLFLHDLEAFSGEKGPGEPLDGGPDVSLAITAAGQKYSFNQLSELSEADRRLAEAIVREMELLVPGEMWAEIDQLQAELEAESY